MNRRLLPRAATRKPPRRLSHSGTARGTRPTGPSDRGVAVALPGSALPDIDFKAGSPEKLVAVLARRQLLGKVTLYCGDWDLLRRTLEVSPNFLIRTTAPQGIAGLPVLMREFHPPIVNMDWPEFSERLIVASHLAGAKAFVNTLGRNDTEFGMLRESGV